ncbi:MAG: hypothetical protein FWJ74_00515 [Gemmatimonadota bacterium]|jgi:hypothetical protein
MTPHRLLATRRSVPAESTHEYETLWDRLRAAVSEAGGRGWRFRSPARPDLYLEFIESRALDAVLANESVAGARRALDEAFGAATAEEWEEVTPS